MSDNPSLLVSTDWLADHLADENLRILDATWHVPGGDRDAQAEYRAAHISGAQFFDMAAISDPDTSLPHMAPPPDLFVRRVQELGIGDGDQVVIYDDSAVHSAARVWWLFRLMGVSNVAILDGGLAKWRAEGRPLDQAAPAARDAKLTVQSQPTLVRNATEVAAATQNETPQIVDARSAERFQGASPEPREGLRAGHIPGAINLPYRLLYNEDGTMKDADALRENFANAGVDLDRPIITTCGSGVTAASLFVALEKIGHTQHSLYDGSWAEWGMKHDLPVAKGE